MADVNGSNKEDSQKTEDSSNGAELNGSKIGDVTTESQEENKSDNVNPTVQLDPETRAKKIKRQIEYYFGDFNLPTDKFLREEVKKKEGWIPLETMVKFKRLATLTTEPSVIVEALEKSELIQISEDKTEIRRNPDKPLPEENEARRKEIIARSVYVKGFPTEDFTIDSALDFFEEFGPTDDVVMRFWQDKATKTWKFKGSVFVKFPTREDAATFLAREQVKFGDEILIRMYQEEYIEKKRNERLEQKMLKRKKPEMDIEEKPSDDKGLPKDATLHMTNIPEGLPREAVKERLEELGLSVAFIDYNKGDPEGWIRLYEAGSTASVMKNCEDNGVLKLKDGQEITLKPLEGEEEEKFLESARKSISDRRAKGNRQQRGRRGGGRGGRGGRGGWGRGRRHESGGEPRAKAAKIEDGDDDD